MGRTHDITISAFDLDRLEAQIDDEAALADRLVKVVEHSAKIIGPPDSEHDSRWVTDDELDDMWNRTQSALAAWKEARND